MRGRIRSRVALDAIAQRRQIDTRHQMFPRTQQHGRYGEVQFVDQPRLQIGAHGGDPAADANILSARRLPRKFEHRLDPVVDEVEDRPALISSDTRG